MKKKKIEKASFIAKIIFYAIYVIIGIILLKYPEIELLEPMRYSTPIFYVLGFLSIIIYFIHREEDNYEELFLGLINILAGSYILFYSYYSNTSFILGNTILVYSIAVLLNKGWNCIRLSRANDIKMFPKFAVTILLTLLGTLVINNLYSNITMQTIILGYYFLCFGAISLMEPFMTLIIKNKKINKYLMDVLEEEYKRETKTIKKVDVENINKKSLKFENKEETKTIEKHSTKKPTNKKKTVKKVIKK